MSAGLAALDPRLPLLMPAAGWVAGLVAGRTDLVPLGALPWIVALLSVLLLWRGRQLRRFCVAGLCGLAWAGMSLMWDARQVVVSADWLSAPREVTARVGDIRHVPGYSRLMLRDVRRMDGRRLAGLALLYVHGRQSSDIRPGDRIRATARWRLPENRLNPGAFDYRAYCFDRHIALAGSLRGQVRILASEATWLQRARQRIRQALAPLADGEGGVLSALLLADRSRIPAAVWDAFSAGGAAHLLAISGLHISMVAVFAGLLCWWALSRREAWIVRWPLRRLCPAVGLVAALAYAALAGWPLPVRRAVLMLAATATAWWMRDRAAPLNTLLAALILVLLFDAGAIASISLWLSFAAAGALLIWADHGAERTTHRARQWLVGMLWASLVATLATLPLVAQVFGRLPVYGLPANLMLVPLYAFVVLPVTLLGGLAAVAGALPAAKLLFAVAGHGVAWGNAVLMAMHAWPGGNLWLPAVSPWLGLMYVAGMAAAGWAWLRRRRMPALGLAALTLAIYVSVVVAERPPARPEFVAWDVGQGAAASLLLPNGRVFSIDAPGMKGSRFNGGTIAAAGLRALGMAHVDVLAISHAQSDHIGGILRLLDGMRCVRELWLADVPWNHAHAGIRAIVARIRADGGRVRWLAAGAHAHVAGLDVRVLWPPAGYDPPNRNNASLVLSLRLAGGESLLLPGDIEAGAEDRLVDGGLADHDVILLPHHGSRTSSTPGWVRATAPGIAIVQTGRHNRYGFPAPEVVRRYVSMGARLWNTASGAVRAEWPLHAAGQPIVTHYRPARERKRRLALQWWQRHL